MLGIRRGANMIQQHVDKKGNEEKDEDQKVASRQNKDGDEEGKVQQDKIGEREVEKLIENTLKVVSHASLEAATEFARPRFLY
jgi:hypothetical protein